MRISDWSSRVLFRSGDLDRVVAVRRQALDGGDRGIGGLRHGGQAAPHRAAVEVHGAGAAEAGAAAVLGAAQAELVSEVLQEGHLRDAVALAVDAVVVRGEYILLPAFFCLIT